MTRRTRWTVTSAVAIAALGVLTAVLVHQAHDHNPKDAQPPPLGPHQSDVQRIAVVADGFPASPTGGIQLPGGRSVTFSVVTNDLINPVPGPHEAELALEPDDTHADWHLVKAGDVITEYGIRVKVLKIWRMPNPDHDAADVRADRLPTPPPSPFTPIPSTPATASAPAS